MFVFWDVFRTPRRLSETRLFTGCPGPPERFDRCVSAEKWFTPIQSESTSPRGTPHKCNHPDTPKIKAPGLPENGRNELEDITRRHHLPHIAPQKIMKNELSAPDARELGQRHGGPRCCRVGPNGRSILSTYKAQHPAVSYPEPPRGAQWKPIGSVG